MRLDGVKSRRAMQACASVERPLAGETLVPGKAGMNEPRRFGTERGEVLVLETLDGVGDGVRIILRRPLIEAHHDIGVHEAAAYADAGQAAGLRLQHDQAEGFTNAGM